MLDFADQGQLALMKKAEAARLARISRRQFDNFLRYGPLEPVQAGACTYVTRTSVLTLIAMLHDRPAAEAA